MDVETGLKRIAQVIDSGSDFRGLSESFSDDTDRKSYLADLFDCDESFFCDDYGGVVQPSECIGGGLCAVCDVCEYRSFFVSYKRKCSKDKRSPAKHGNSSKTAKRKSHVKTRREAPQGRVCEESARFSDSTKDGRSKGPRGTESSRNSGDRVKYLSRPGQEIETRMRRGFDISKFKTPVTNESNRATGRVLGTDDRICFGKQILYVGVCVVKRYDLLKSQFVRYWIDDESANETEVALEFMEEYEDGAFKLSKGRDNQGDVKSFKISSTGLRRALASCGSSGADVVGHCQIKGSQKESGRVWIIVDVSPQCD